MTTNQTIDGVPRALLGNISVYLADSPNAIMRARAKELRALLDATDAGISASPAAPKPTGLSQGWNLTRKHDGFVVGHQSMAYPPDEKAIQRAERGGYVWVPFLLPAAQPQGEPVAYRYKELQQAWENEKPWELATVALGLVYLERKELAERGVLVGKERETYLGLTIEPLYAEQPAPVAVLPERLQQVLKFLDGAENLDGQWFGEPHPSGRPYWWRNELRKALAETNLFAKQQ
ncbi:hypothetical protein ACI77M_03895 [Pseudomonas fildesensis]|uniref:hypothetical protein n=1 Tax=Pseudomonas fildesensis TaxID=1674920 RepID=UPI00387A9550